ncbi:MAG: secondary thiamine-phosphate synthase enzyme YjbQ [Pseudomonadota bacterium]
MRQSVYVLHVPTRGPGLVPIGRLLDQFLASEGQGTMGGGQDDGLLTLFCQHTSASLTIQENADPDVRLDLQDGLAALAPHGRALGAAEPYRHATEGPDDMAAHLRAALTGVQLSIPVFGGALALGTWQGVYLWEHRDGPQRRRVACHLLLSPRGGRRGTGSER